VGPEHSHLLDSGRATYEAVTDDEALDAFSWLARREGILPALESSHAIALALRSADRFGPDDVVVINLSGRGDKDLSHAAAAIAARELTNSPRPSLVRPIPVRPRRTDGAHSECVTEVQRTDRGERSARRPSGTVGPLSRST
jgi:threonine synthase